MSHSFKHTQRVAIAGAGFSGAVIAHELATAGYPVDVFEERAHVAGNCHTARDPETGIMVHTCGPHIFHTSNPQIWNYVRQFDEFMPFTNRVKAITGGRIYSLPINLLTINQFFGETFSPAEARAFLGQFSHPELPPAETFEEQAFRHVGPQLYQAFLKEYTRKQWGVAPAELPASLLKRLPVRFDYNDNYYDSPFQGIPRNGYTHVITNLLTHPHIRLHLEQPFDQTMKADFTHVFYSGRIDRWFNFCAGSLDYRTLDFAMERHEGDYQGNPVINYCDDSVPWTRVSEHKHFAPWETHERTIIYREYSRACEITDIPYYPLRLANDKSILTTYINLAKKEEKVTFIGRLGTYRYLDMHVCIAESIEAARQFIMSRKHNTDMPAFIENPLGSPASQGKS
jgi:UDP-galactopyranose mutase